MTSLTAQRRSFIKWLAGVPVLATIAGRELSNKLSAAVGKASTPNVYERIGVRPFINARGTWTYLSGSLELPEVRTAMEAASQQFVDMFELQRAAGKRLAEISGAESGMVTSGAAGAMAAATAACIAGKDQARIWQLPDTTGLKNEVIMLGGRSPFDSAIRLVGARLVMSPSPADLRGVITDKTAMVYTTWRDERLEKALAITKEAGVPFLLDDAAGIPPIQNLSRYAKAGADLYCFSGGKGLRGPQCSGLLLGRKDLIEAALANCSPWEGAVCRAMKVGKEEMIGLLAAVEAWSRIDLKKLNDEWGKRVGRIAKLVEMVPGVSSDIRIPTEGNSYPTLTVRWDEKKFGLTVEECDQQLRVSNPRIEVLTSSNPSLLSVIHEGGPKEQALARKPNQLQIVSMTLQEGEDLVVGQRLRDILRNALKNASR